MRFEGFLLFTQNLWLPLGLLAIAAAVLNLVCSIRKRRGEPWRFLSLALTALTMCSFYSMDAHWIQEADWSALEDVTVAITPICWVLVLLSITVNGITFLWNKEKLS